MNDTRSFAMISTRNLCIIGQAEWLERREAHSNIEAGGMITLELVGKAILIECTLQQTHSSRAEPIFGSRFHWLQHWPHWLVKEMRILAQ